MEEWVDGWLGFVDGVKCRGCFLSWCGRRGRGFSDVGVWRGLLVAAWRIFSLLGSRL